MFNCFTVLLVLSKSKAVLCSEKALTEVVLGLFLPTSVSKPALGPTQILIHWVPEVLFPEAK